MAQHTCYTHSYHVQHQCVEYKDASSSEPGELDEDESLLPSPVIREGEHKIEQGEKEQSDPDGRWVCTEDIS